MMGHDYARNEVLRSLRARTSTGQAISNFLAIVRQVLDSPSTIPDEGEATTARRKYKATITAVAEFCLLIEPDSESAFNALSHFMQLSTVLDDLERGTVHPIVAPRNLSHRAPDRNDIWELRGTVVAALEFLRAAGRPQKEAMKVICSHKSIGRLCNAKRGSKKADLYSSVLSWRKSLANETVECFGAKVIVTHAQRECRAGHSREDFESMAQQWLDNAAKAASRVIVEKPARSK
jgi:hypothetical protein